jgi:sugar lactone lactonase YvrE
MIRSGWRSIEVIIVVVAMATMGIGACATKQDNADEQAPTGAGAEQPAEKAPVSEAAEEVAPAMPVEDAVGDLETVAKFDGPIPTGVTVSKEGRVFVNFPRWGDEPAFTVAEVVDGEAVAYPNAAINEGDTSAPKEHFISVQSVVVGPKNRLWVLDTGSPRFEATIENAAKLVAIDLETDEVVQTIVFPPDVVREASYTNDVRFDLTRGEAGMAFITDSSGAGENGIIVVDLASGESWRRLDKHSTTQAEENFIPYVEGQPLMFRSGEGEPAHMTVGADGIAIHADGERLFYRVLSGRGLFSVSIDALADRDMSDKDVAGTIKDHGDLGFASDGLEADAAGNIYLTNYEDNGVVRMNAGGSFDTIVHDPRALWPDTLAVGPDGYLYFTANQLHRQANFHGGEDMREKPYVLFRVEIGEEPVRLGGEGELGE